jgi:signal transduction histidine kinase
MPALDIRTVLVCITLTELVLCLVVILFWRTQRTYPGFPLWVACNTLLAGTYLLFSLRGVIPDFLTIVVANTLIAAALSARLIGLRQFFGMSLPRLQIAVLVPLVSFLALVYFTYVQDSVLARGTLITILAVTYLIECARLLLKSATPSTRPLYQTFAVVYLLYALCMIGRQIAWFVVPESRGLLAATPVNVAAFLLFIPLDIMVTSAYLIMNSQRMQEELQATELDDRQQRTLSEALRDSAASLNSTLDLQQVLNRILENVGRVVPHDAADVMLIDAAAGVTNVIQCMGYEKFSSHNPSAMGALHFRVGAAVNLREAARTRRPYILDDVTHERDWLLVAETRWIHSNLTVPIVIEAEVVGFLSLNSATPAFFTASQGERLSAFADQAAIAIKNARLYSASRQYAAELETRNQELDAFAHTVAHDLKNPLWALVGTAELLADDEQAMSPAEIRRSLVDIIRSGQKMNSIIEEILVLAGVHKAGAIRFEALDMEAIVAEARARIAFLADEPDAMIVEPDEWPTAYGHAPWVEEIWVNYLSNALKYGGRPPRIEVGAMRLENGMIRCWVRDNGVGIPPAMQGQLFGAFTRLGGLSFEGSGLGLSIVKRIVERHGGEVGVESTGNPGEGSTFSFTLPGNHRPGMFSLLPST